MRLSGKWFNRFAAKLVGDHCLEVPDFSVGPPAYPYLHRWWLVRRNRICNVYLHCFMRDDDDRALHDHPYPSVSILLLGDYFEHTAPDGVAVRTLYRTGSVIWRLRGSKGHRIELSRSVCWTLFITGPRYREWGFHCPKGWVRWQDFTKPAAKGEIGKGCD